MGGDSAELKVGSYKRKRKKSTADEDVFTIMKLLFWVGLGICAMVSVQSNDQRIAIAVIICIVVSVFWLYCVWALDDNGSHIAVRIFESALAALPWLIYLVIRSDRVGVLICTAVVLALLCFETISFILRKKTYILMWVAFGVVFLYLVSSMGFYSFVDKSKVFPFWQVSLILAVAATVVYIILTIKVIFKSEEKLFEKILRPIVIFAMSFMFVWVLTCNLNYALDTDPPKEYITVIEDKDINRIRSRRSKKTEYSFELNINGDIITVNVTKTEYDLYEIGDKFPLEMCSGAFNEPFYISGNISS